MLLRVGTFVKLPNCRVGRLSWIDDENVAYFISGYDVGVMCGNILNFCNKSYINFVVEEV
jgi:hypothetical protein